MRIGHSFTNSDRQHQIHMIIYELKTKIVLEGLAY